MPEIVTNGRTMVIIDREAMPASYQKKRPELGPKQLAWLERHHPGLKRSIVQRSWAHKPWCKETCSPPICDCQTKEKPE